MQTVFDRAGGVVELVFESPDELAGYLDRARERGMLVVRLPEAPGDDARVTVRLRSGERSIELRAEVQQVFRSGTAGHGVRLRVETPETLQPPKSAAEAVDDETTSATRPASEPGLRGATDSGGASSAIEIRKMNVTQRMRLAMRASRIERQILLRDRSAQVLMGLVANPRIDDREVLELVRSPHASTGVLQRLAKDRRWSANYEIRLALVRSPKTPTPLALRLLPTLRRTDLQALAKSSHVREAIKGAALRLYLKQL